MELNEALRILAECHTRDHPEVGYVVESAPPSWHMEHSTRAYLEAWGAVRKHLGLSHEMIPHRHPI